MADISLITDRSDPNFMDWMVDDTGDIVMTSDIEDGGTNPILQAALQALFSFKGEWFLNTNDGFPWFQILSKGGPGVATALQTAFQRALLGVPGILRLNQLSVVPQSGTRVALTTFSAKTAQGTINWSGNIEYGPTGGGA